MKSRLPTLLGAALLLAGLVLIPLHVLAPAGPPHQLSTGEWLRLLIGLPVVLWLPGVFGAALWFGKDVRSGEGLSLPWLLLAGAGLQILWYAGHFGVLRLLGLPMEWPTLLPPMLLVGGVGLGVLLRRGVELAPLGRPLALAGATAAAVVLLFSAWKAPHLARDGSWYFYDDDVQMGWDAVEDRGAIELKWADGRPFEPGVPFPRDGRVIGLEVTNNAPSPQRVPLLLLLHGPIGASLEVVVGDFRLADELIADQVVGPYGPHPVERYHEWGTASAVAQVEVQPGDTALVELIAVPPATDRQPDPNDMWLVAWAKLSGGEVLDELASLGHHHMAPGQLLNVTENVRWASEVAGPYWLSGRSPDGSSTLHQPPAWTYLYAPARQLLTRHMASGSALFLAILLAIPLVGLRASEEQGGALNPLLAVVLGVGAVQHGRLMVADGSMNFPDNLYALALLVAATSLVAGRARVFVLWAFLAALLRYPGAVVVAFSGFVYLALDAERRRRASRAMLRFGLVVAAFCGVMLLVGVLSGQLDTWFFALYFETIPEHFDNNPEALPLLQRPPLFLWIWGLVGGGVALLGAPWRGALSKVTLGTALLYAPLLAFIDHFSHHYFLPLIALVSVSTVASISRVENPSLRWGLSAAAALLAVALLGAANALGI